MTRQHDIVIVGGGLVGASLAIALEPLGLDVALLEATPAGDLPTVFDQRNLSLSETTCIALQRLGVWSQLAAPPAPIRRIHISRRGDFGQAVLDAARYGREAFGHVVVARDFGLALETRLAQLSGLTRYRPARFLGTGIHGDGHRLHVAMDEGDRTLQARLLVGADGTASAVRDALGIRTETFDYGQTLFVCRAQSTRWPDGNAYERLGDAGPTAVLPRSDGAYGVIHGVAATDADGVAALDDAAYRDRLQEAIGWRVGRWTQVGPRSRYPLRRVLAQAFTAERAVLLGNAAQTIHPIGAQGFNIGLRDALTLFDAIREGGDDPGDSAVLERYTQHRHDDRRRTLAFSHDLARATATRGLLASGARAMAMAAVAQLPALQAGMVSGAMGYRGHVPSLCRKDLP